MALSISPGGGWGNPCRRVVSPPMPGRSPCLVSVPMPGAVSVPMHCNQALSRPIGHAVSVPMPGVESVAIGLPIPGAVSAPMTWVEGHSRTRLPQVDATSPRSSSRLASHLQSLHLGRHIWESIQTDLKIPLKIYNIFQEHMSCCYKALKIPKV